MSDRLPSRLHEVKVRKVVEITTCEGEGTQDDLAREVTWFFSEAGELLAWHDPTDNKHRRMSPWMSL